MQVVFNRRENNILKAAEKKVIHAITVVLIHKKKHRYICQSELNWQTKASLNAPCIYRKREKSGDAMSKHDRAN